MRKIFCLLLLLLLLVTGCGQGSGGKDEAGTKPNLKQKNQWSFTVR